MSNSEPIEESKQINSDVPYWSKRSNIAPIKSEYVIWSKFEKDSVREGDEGDDGRRDDELEAEGGNRKKRKSNLIDNENETNEQENSKKNETENENENEKSDEVESTEIQEEKKIKLTKSQKKQRAIEARKQSKGKGGMNKARSFLKTQEMISVQLCSFVSVEKECTRGIQENQNLPQEQQEQKQEQKQDPVQQGQPQAQQAQPAEKQQGQPKCKFNHDIKSYMQEKSNDIKSFIGQDLTKFSDEEIQQVLSNQETNVLNSPNWITKCPLFESFGTCSFGYRCKFLSSHLENVSPGSGYQGTNHKLLIDSSKFHQREKFDELNGLPFEMIRKIRKKLYDLPLTKSYLDSIGELMDQRQFDEKGRLMASKPNLKSNQKPTITSINQTEKNQKVIDESEVNETKEIKPVQLPTESYQDAQKDLPVDLTPIRSNEKTRLNWREKLYLAPLTTVGNLPFRRLCSTLGCEITCGEMALCQDLIGANTNEWSLVKRHPSEKIFGVQVAGSRPQLLVPAAEMIGNELKVDFVDVNCGCPIDLVFKKGSGAALLEHTQRLGKSLIGMSKVLKEIPLTIKLRTGITEGKNLAHKIIPQLQHWGVGATTLHGRSRQQRYSKRADWNYISECVKTLHRTFEEEPDLPQIPIFGNGDCYDYREYYENMEMSGVDGIMIARGALTKPWIFTEIKERRDWDISSRERLDQIGKLASFGLEHWGSDTQGVNTTRRFLCESLGFQYRYVPVGLLERLPARINDRPYPFKGRDELETLLASGSSKDWVKISELFLGPTPIDWNFIPKHKSNAYEEGNG